MDRRHLSILGVLLAAAVISGCSNDKPVGYQGYVEGDYVYIASPVAARLEHLLVQQGQVVEANTSLFELDAEPEIAAKQQAEAQLSAAQAQLSDLKLGKRSPELAVVQAQLAQAKAAQEQAARQLKRDEAQLAAGGIPRSQLEESRANEAIKAAHVRELSDQVEVARLPARQDQLRVQIAQVAAALAAVRQSAWRLDQTRGTTPRAGLVAHTMYREGEWVPAGSPIVRMLPPENVKVRFFVPEAIAGSLRTGRKVKLDCDGCPADLGAVVSYISDQPEFTSPIIYSNDTRSKLVFMVEARPASAMAAQLRPGQPVGVTLLQ